MACTFKTNSVLGGMKMVEVDEDVVGFGLVIVSGTLGAIVPRGI